MEQVPFDGPILVITGPTFTKLADDASCDTDDLTSLECYMLNFHMLEGINVTGSGFSCSWSQVTRYM